MKNEQELIDKKEKDKNEVRYININKSLNVKKSPKVFSNIFKYIILIIIVIIIYNIILVIYTKNIKKEGKSFFGLSGYVVTTGSMKPTLKIGDIVIANEKEKEFYVGDIVVFKSKNDLNVTHRITKKEDGDIFLVEGDANLNKEKEYISKKNIIGKVVFKFPVIGKVFLGTENILYIFILIIISILIHLQIRKVEIKKEERRRRRKEKEKESFK